MSIKKIYSLCLLLLALFSPTGFAAEEFLVKKIRVEGLQRISLPTVLDYLPIHEGQVVTDADTSAIIRDLYQTGFFSDVSLSRQGNELIINVVERPTIGLIRISGNKQIKTKDLMNALKEAGIAEGLTYDNATVSGMKQALIEQYYQLGRYDASVETKITQENRNRVAVDIQINEGHVAKVQQINIIGSQAISEKKLKKSFKLTTPHLWTWFTKSDQYSREKLDKDLEALRDYYLDRGYLKFRIDSTQVTMTPDRKNVYIAVRITEGPVYTIKGTEVTGNLLGYDEAVRKLIALKPGEVFSRGKVIAITENIKNFYANQGYANASVNVVPNADDVNHQVFVTFQINPGEIIYVRRVEYSGNTKTADYVLRRATRQMEGGAYSTSRLNETTRLLNNLGYLENVEMKTEPVPDEPNQVDVHYSMKEASSATASAQVGYSDNYGFMYGASIVQKNYMGTGKTVSLGFNNSSYAQTYSLGYFNPYYTASGISRGFNFYVQKVTPGNTDISPYTLDSYGGLVTYRIPVSEYDAFSVGYGYEYSHVSSNNPSAEITDFIDENGSKFNTIKLTAGWTHNSYDRAIFPTRGFNQWLGGEVGLPILPDSLDYYKLNYNAKWYHPIYKGFILYLDGDLGYGNGYGNLDELPFFKNYYAGGMGTVRGYDSNTLGPRDSNGNALGGNVLTTGSVNLIVPNPFPRRLRTSLYVDGGNVYANSPNFADLRYSTGIEVDWISPMGLLQFSLGKAINPKEGDQMQLFQFSVGTSF